METSLFTNSSANTSSSGVSAQATTSNTSDMFTKLLVAQIQNQDPLSPSDPADFVNQLAQLSQTESMSNLSALTASNTSVLESMQVLALGAQVGSEVMVNTSSVQLDGSTVVKGSIALSNASSSTTLTLTSSNGTAHKIELGSQAAGTVPISIDPAALGLPAGNYTMAVSTSNGQVPTVDIAGKLTSVRLSSTGSMILKVSGLGEVSPSAITGFNGTSSLASVN